MNIRTDGISAISSLVEVQVREPIVINVDMMC